MLINKYNIALTEDFNLDVTIDLITFLCKNMDLSVALYKYHNNSNTIYSSDFNFHEFLSEIENGKFKQTYLTNRQISQIKKETLFNLDFTLSYYYKCYDKDYLKSFMTIEFMDFSFHAIQKKGLKYVFLYGEHDNGHGVLYINHNSNIDLYSSLEDYSKMNALKLIKSETGYLEYYFEK